MPVARPLRRPTVVLVAIAMITVLLIPAANAALARQATPAATPVVSLQTTSVNGTPVAGTPMAGTQGQLYPGVAVAYGRFPDYVVPAGPSDTGHELRLYRIELPAGATQTLADSTNWGITVEDGAVDMTSPVDAGGQSVRIDDEIQSGQSFSHGPGTVPDEANSDQQRTLAHAEGDPAIAWVVTLVPGGTAELTPGDGATPALAGSMPLPGLAAEALVAVTLNWSGASPVGRALDEPRLNPSYIPADGSLPAALVVAIDDGITVNAPDGTVSELAANEARVIPDATGWTVTGALEDYRDDPLRAVVATARAVDLVPYDQQQIPMQATPVPIAIPADAVTYEGEPVACEVEPRTIEELEELPNLILATPELYDEVTSRLQDDVLTLTGTGEPLDEATRESVLRSLAEINACGTSGDILRYLALFSDPLAAVFVATFPPEALGELTGTPAAAGTPGSGFTVSTPDPTADTSFRAWGFEQFPDGRVGVFLAGNEIVSYLILVAGPDGIWLIDGFSQNADIAMGSGLPLG